MLRKLTVVDRKLTSIEGYKRNARTHPEAQIKQIVRSIEEFGWTNPVLIDEKGIIIAGHGRLEAAKRMELPSIPCIVLAGMSDAQKRAYRIADNKIPLNSGWDLDLLKAEFEMLKVDFPDLSLTGFDIDEISLMTDAEAGDDLDAIPRPKGKTRTREGDIWQLGEHRILCGDSTLPKDIARLFGDKRFTTLFTSPPYLEQRDYKKKAVDWQVLMRGVFANLRETDDAQILVNIGIIYRDGNCVEYWRPWVDWMREDDQGWRLFGWYVWDQGPGMPGKNRGRLANSHEFIFHFNRNPRPVNKIIPCKDAGQKAHRGNRQKSGKVTYKPRIRISDRKIPDSVFRVVRHKARGIEVQHPAVFPVDLAIRGILSFSKRGDIVFDPFTGSGTTLIACEQEGRICYGLEHTAEYCDIIVARWELLTGKKAKVIHGGKERT